MFIHSTIIIQKSNSLSQFLYTDLITNIYNCYYHLYNINQLSYQNINISVTYNNTKISNMLTDESM